jgi:hypothetical protein
MLAENVNCQIKKLRVQKNQFLKVNYFKSVPLVSVSHQNN